MMIVIVLIFQPLAHISLYTVIAWILFILKNWIHIRLHMVIKKVFRF